MIDNPSREELGTTAPTTITKMTRKSTETFGCTSTISDTCDDVSTSAALAIMKKKYAAAKSMSKSSVIQTQPSSHSTPAIP